jgi:hypothetical protein
MEFKRFYFEGNFWWGYVNSPADLVQLFSAYTYEELRKAQRLYNSADYTDPHFGFYAEYNDKYTLGDWIDENNLSQYFIQ